MTLVVDEIITEDGAYVFQKIQGNSTQTTIGTQNVYVPITGTRVDSQIQGFTAGASTLTYDGATTKKFKVDASFTWEAGSTLNNQYKISVMKNGSTLIGEVRSALDNSVGYPRNSSLNTIVELATDDTIECMVTNEDGTQDVLVIDMLLTIENL